MSAEPITGASNADSSLSRASNVEQLSNNARYKRRMRMYKNHRKYHPYDTTFERLEIPDCIKHVPPAPKRPQHTKQQSAIPLEGRLETAELSSDNYESNGAINRTIPTVSTQLISIKVNENSKERVESLKSSAVNSNISLDNSNRITNYYYADRDEDDDEEDEETDGDYEDDGVETALSSKDDANSMTNEEGGDDDEVDSLDEQEWTTEVPNVDTNTDDEFDDLIERTSRPVKFRPFVTSFVLIMSYLATAIRSKLTYATLLQLFQTMKKLTVGNTLPSYMKKLLGIFSKTDERTCIRHYYCRKCLGTVGKGSKPQTNCTCGACGPRKNKKFLSYFIEVKIEPQLRQLFKDPAAVESLNYRSSRKGAVDDYIRDIFDGKKYKELSKPGGFLSSKYNFTFTIFTDGCKASASSGASAWPIMLLINEFPPHARKRHILLAGIWVDTMHPDLNHLLLPTVKELNNLYDNGISWKHPIDGNVIISKFTTIVCTADSVARYEILNMARFNGKNGCTFCEGDGQTVRHNGKVRRVYPVETFLAKRRSDFAMRRDMKKAHDKKVQVNGVRGYSTMILLKGFDLGSGVIVDSMHNVFLGVAKFHSWLLLGMKSKLCNGQRYPGKKKKITEIDARLLNIRPPTRISRTPRSIKEMKQWKASEWRNWLQFYALPCLHGLIEEKYLQHLGLLSCATYILNQDCISTQELKRARELLHQYTREFQSLFGTENMRYNIHLLNHISDSVRNWGPFWTHGAFPFESWNKRIVDKITSPNSRPLQIFSRYMLTRYVEKQFHDPRVDDETKSIINSILTDNSKNRKYLIHSTPSVGPKFQGIGKIVDRSPTDRESIAIRLAGYDGPRNIGVYQHAVVNGADVASRGKDDNNETKYCNRYIYCESVDGYGDIVDIIQFRCPDGSLVSGLLVEKMTIRQQSFGVDHIHRVSPTLDITFFVADEDSSPVIPAILMNSPDRDGWLISRLPNQWETD